VSGPLAVAPLAGSRVRLLPAAAEHVPAFAAILADPSVARWWMAVDPESDARKLVEPEDEDVVAWAIEAVGAVVGVIQAWEEPDPEYRHAGVDLARAGPYQGRGLGPDAIRVVVRWLFEERGHHRVVIDPAAANVNAIRAYAKVGFRPVGVMRDYERGVDGAWHDGLLMDLLRGDLVDG
jgi:aminoglycoside 6'-N-acetyltransferase